MKAKTKVAQRKTAPPTPVRGRSWQPYAIAAAVAFVMVLWAYGPSMTGPFLFDDTYLPFALPGADAPLSAWIHGVRPVLMASYWLSAHLAGETTYAYHALNIVVHLLAGGLLFLILRRLLEWATVEAPRREWLAGFAAFLFLLHPVETEAVAYLAGRSESLSTLLVLASYAVFLYRKRPAISWLESAAVLTLFGAALLTKEQTIALPALFLLTDFWWDDAGFSLRGIARNWKLYAPMALVAAGGLVFFWRLLFRAESAGFGLRDFTWYQYFFTQCRALFVYLGEFLFPVSLNADWSFPVSHTVLEHGAVFGLVALVALAVLAWFVRRRFRLAAFGWFTFLILMAPTSSILPIRDVIAERRLYFASLGLLLIVIDLVSRLRIPRNTLLAAGTVVLLLAAIATHARAGVWSSEATLWEDTVAKSPDKPRGHFQLAQAYYDAGQCDRAVAEFRKTSTLEPPTYNLLVDWALAYDCAGDAETALAKLRQAAALDPTAHVYSQIAMVYAKRSDWSQALDALDEAERRDANFAITYVYRGNIHLKLGKPDLAMTDFRHALEIDPSQPDALQGLSTAQASLRTRR